MNDTNSAKVLGKWLWVIFWMTIAATIESILLGNELAEKIIPGCALIDTIIALVFFLVRSVIIYKLSTVEKNIKYRESLEFLQLVY